MGIRSRCPSRGAELEEVLVMATAREQPAVHPAAHLKPFYCRHSPRSPPPPDRPSPIPSSALPVTSANV